MKSYIIILRNHDKSEEYGSQALLTGKEQGWDVERFDAIDGRVVSLFEFNIKPTTLNKKCFRAFSRPGVIGCFLSHYTLWKKCLNENKPIGIFEQDIIFQKPPIFNQEFLDILRLDKPASPGKNCGTGEWWEGSHAYILKPEGAKKLINWTNQFGAFPSDVMLGNKILNINFDTNNLTLLNMDSRKFSLTKSEIF
jgi:GR25 family glycosyltransferase involved in LPS biosynthesis